MRTLVVYDSFFGNTEKIARAIGDAVDPIECAGVARVSEVKVEQLEGIELLIVGSPTRGFRPSPATSAFLKSVSPGALDGIRVAAFDTRISAKDTSSWLLRVLVKIFGYAADPIARQMVSKGGRLALAPEGFYVKDSEGPLKEGELERAARWSSLCQK